MKQKSVLLAIAVLLGLRIIATAQTPPSYVPTNGLVGWWPFNGNANDESGNGNNGAVASATLTEDRFGNENSAFAFDSSHILIPHNNSLDFINVSISFWMKCSNTSWGAIIKQTNYEDASFESFGIGTNGITSRLRLGANYNDPECIPGDGWEFVEAASAIYDDEFHHIICIINNDTITIYVDGILDSQVTVNYPEMSPCYGGDIQFGRDWSGPNHFYQGVLDDVGIWNRALNEVEITSIYNESVLNNIKPNSNVHILNIYPNPTADRITIDLGAGLVHNNCAVSIENALGQKVFESCITQPLSDISLGALAGSGLYFVRIIDSQGVPVETRAIVVE
jgi:hypothetical protein